MTWPSRQEARARGLQTRRAQPRERGCPGASARPRLPASWLGPWSDAVPASALDGATTRQALCLRGQTGGTGGGRRGFLKATPGWLFPARVMGVAFGSREGADVGAAEQMWPVASHFLGPLGLAL